MGIQYPILDGVLSFSGKSHNFGYFNLGNHKSFLNCLDIYRHGPRAFGGFGTIFPAIEQLFFLFKHYVQVHHYPLQ